MFIELSTSNINNLWTTHFTIPLIINIYMSLSINNK